MSFHLRPVSENSPSPSSSASTTTAGEHSPPSKHQGPHQSTPSAQIQPRRPLSPSSLRDVNLTQDANPAPRKYPAPPTGHELMALFPPARPANFPEMRPGPTSGFFQRQERAFFAQAGNEIVRVRVEIDVPPQSSDEPHSSVKSRDPSAQSGLPRTWPQLHPQHHSPVESSAASSSTVYAHSKRQSRAIPATAQPSAAFPVSPHGQPPQPPLNLHTPPSHHSGMSLRTPPHDPHPGGPGTKAEFQGPDEYRDDADESWRRPTPYADRRRAGKHTRRVIVRN
ncbi:hypothetical protein PAXINDRAFT_110567 [Paxillus involutus ATCC 200175]|nr:hypothetical protein PAXINDRAFT_110567 [Paxillus involutus ATCC 200175]